MALLSRPFCPYNSRQAGLWYLPARWRDTTRNRKATKRGRKRLLLRFERIQQRHYGMKLMAYTLIKG